MKVFKILGVVLALVGVAVAILSTRMFEPVVGFPGGALTGSEGPFPANWAMAADINTIQLETRSSDTSGEPYSVNLWGVGVGSNFYVATSAEGTAWSRNLDANPLVRLRVKDSVYSLQAVRVTNPEEIKPVYAAYVAKYDVDETSIEGNAGNVYRLDAR